MKNLKRIALIILMCVLMVNTTYASQLTWETVPGHHDQSILLEEGVTEAEDSIYRYGRGDYLAEGSVQIANLQDGRLRIDVATLAHVDVDRILHSVFVDMWDENRERWINLESWDFEKTKEEMEDGRLYMLETSFTIDGYIVGKYYRVRGLHGVECNDELEACATETNGVLLTDWMDW